MTRSRGELQAIDGHPDNRRVMIADRLVDGQDRIVPLGPESRLQSPIAQVLVDQDPHAGGGPSSRPRARRLT
jgi:hypothetical protein